MANINIAANTSVLPFTFVGITDRIFLEGSFTLIAKIKKNRLGDLLQHVWSKRIRNITTNNLVYQPEGVPPSIFSKLGTILCNK
jgi:hypothetical protein